MTTIELVKKDSEATAEPGAPGFSPEVDRVPQIYAGELPADVVSDVLRRRINWVCGQCVGETVLEVGCGQGIASILLAREGFRVTGLDARAEAIERARGAAALELPKVQARISWVEGDLDDIPLSEQYDTVILGEVIEHQTAPARFLANVVRRVKAGGRIVLTTPFGLCPGSDRNAALLPRRLVEVAADQKLYTEHLDVVDGFIRMTLAAASNESPSKFPEMEQLLLATETGALASLEALYWRIREESEQLEKSEQAREMLDKKLKALEQKHAAEIEALIEKHRQGQQKKDAEAETARLQLVEALEKKYAAELKALADRYQQNQRERMAAAETAKQQLIKAVEEKHSAELKAVAAKYEQSLLARGAETEREKRNLLEDLEQEHAAELKGLEERNRESRLEWEAEAEKEKRKLLEDLEQKHAAELQALVETNRQSRKERDAAAEQAKQKLTNDLVQKHAAELKAFSDQQRQIQQKASEVFKQQILKILEEKNAADLKQQRLVENAREAAECGSSLLKQLVQADRMIEKVEREKESIQKQLSYRIGSLLVANRFKPWRWPAIPWLFYKEFREFRQYRKEREAKRLVTGSWRLFQPGQQWRTEMALAKKTPHWIEVPVSGYASVNLDFRLQSFHGYSEKGVMLVARCVASDGAPLEIIDSRFKRLEDQGNSSFMPLAVNFNNRNQLKINVPPNAGTMYLSVNRYHDSGPVRVVYESVSVSGAAQSTVRILSLLDQFSEDCFRHEAELIPLDRKHWRQQVPDSGAEFLLAESAWRGNGGTWSFCMTKFSGPRGDDLRGVLALCRSRRIPTVFWNKEDPANFDVFIEVAKEFDYVFTTDAQCIPRYRQVLAHDRIFVLPFAAQPVMHNPIISRKREPRVAFAGSWNGKKYPARAKWLDILMTEPMKRGVLDIYDRHSDSDDESLRFPSKFSNAVNNALPYSEISEEVYKRYAAMINVNSVEDSASMVARRVFELSACATPVISSPSPALEGEFSRAIDVVKSEKDVRRCLDAIIGDELPGLSRGVQGVRIVHSAHTYRHRLDSIRKIVLGDPLENSLHEAVTAICVSRRPDNVKRVAEMLNAQTYPDVRVIFVAHGDGFDEKEILGSFDERLGVRILHLQGRDKVLADGLNLAVANASTDLLAKFDDDDYYGPNYLLDAILAFGYSKAALVGKKSYFCFLENSNKMVLRFPSKHYRFANHVSGATLVWDRRLTPEVTFPRVARGTDTAFLESLKERGVRIFSSDPFNFVAVRHADTDQHTWQIQEDKILRKARHICDGLDLSRVYI